MTVPEHRFNDDLLANDGDREATSTLYPSLMHLLEHPELIAAFKAYNLPANSAKKRARHYGYLAIAAACFALFGAAAEPMLREYRTDSPLLSVVAVGAGLAGILSVVVGGLGLLFGERKREWLLRRLMAERLRQFHFQTFMCGIASILAAARDERALAAFLAERHRRFKALYAQYESKLDGMFEACTDQSNEAPLWLVEADLTLPDVAEAELKPLFEAYRALRICHQINYADYKLDPHGGPLADRPKRLARLLSSVGFVCLVLICTIHVGVLVGTAMPHADFWKGFLTPESTMTIVWIAIVALAVRALENGLQPERELQRYESYRLACRAMLKRFDAAAAPEKLGVIRDMERLCYDEMRTFLIDNDRARFIM